MPGARSRTEGSTEVPLSSQPIREGARPKYSSVKKEPSNLNKNENSFTGEICLFWDGCPF